MQHESDTEEDEDSLLLLQSIVTEETNISEKKSIKRSLDEEVSIPSNCNDTSEFFDEIQIESNSKKPKLSSSNLQSNLLYFKAQIPMEIFPMGKKVPRTNLL